jgi:hypothetical protein
MQSIVIGLCMSKKQMYRVTLSVDGRMFSSEVELNGEPLVGDEIVVFNDPMVGLIVNVRKRSWDSKTGELRLICKHDYVITKEDLISKGWK